uniref:TonB-dependent receptor (BtuB) n=1 Tax=uncultured marine thaumarchaeote KM3_54_G03 TaxID=1456192 RepID=A0A075H7Y7_9ARCH|nr:TonB-dependent receptor (btuB) [uncultured marine thaumarchaeote KM3_54_G03]
MPLPAQTSEFQLEDFSEEMIVVSSRIETPLRTVGTAVSVITAEDIQFQGYNSIAEVLRAQPGIGVTNNGGVGKPTTVRIRGEESYRTLVMIDGVKLADPSGTQVGPTFEHLISTNRIERIEVLRGSQGFIYGADAGGVVNILTRTGAGPVEGEANIGFGKFNTKKMDGAFSGGNDEGDFFISVSDLSSDGYNSKISDTDLMDNDGYENTTLHTKLGWEPADNFRLQLVARDTDAENKFDSCGFPATNDCTGSISQTLFKLSGNYEAGKFTHFLGVGATDVQRSNLWAGVKSFMTEGNIRHAEYVGSVKLSAISTLVYGADLNKEHVVSNSGNNLERNQTGSYLEYQSRVGENYFLTAGARYDDNDDFGKHTSVRISAAQFKDLDGGSTLKYRASYGTGFRAPSLSEIAYNTGLLAFPPATDAPVTEESSTGFDIGIEYTSVSGLYVGATYFNQKIEDEIFFDLAGFSGYLQSFGTNLSRGIELIVEYPITSQWTVLGNLTTNDTENREGLQRIRRPRRLTNIGIRFSSPNNRFRLLAHYRASKDSVDELYGIGRVPLNDHQILDISTVYALSETLETYGRLENVTAEDYQEVIGFRSAGFAAYGGIRIRFR